jgi:hypothetical protein
MVECILEEAGPLSEATAPTGAATSAGLAAASQQQQQRMAAPNGGAAAARQQRLFALVLQPWIDQLLVALKSIITAAWSARDDGGGPAGPARNPAALRQQARAARRRPQRAHRELGVLERLSGAVVSPATARLLGDALAALVCGVITGPMAAKLGTRLKLDEVRALCCQMCCNEWVSNQIIHPS